MNCYILTYSATVHVTSGSVLNSGRFHVPLDNNIYCNWLADTGVQVYSIIISNGTKW